MKKKSKKTGVRRWEIAHRYENHYYYLLLLLLPVREIKTHQMEREREGI